MNMEYSSLVQALVVAVFVLISFVALSVAKLLHLWLKDERSLSAGLRVVVTFFPILLFFPRFHAVNNQAEVKKRAMFVLFCLGLLSLAMVALFYIKGKV